MAVRQVLVRGSPDEVWLVLADGYAYAHWVLGTGNIRSVDANWPELGSSIYFTVGQRWLQLQDRTTVRVIEPGRRLELEAHALRLGTARVAIQLIPWGRDTLVVLDEHPVSGPGSRMHSWVVELLLHLRNRKMLTDLARVVQGRHRQAL
ncbi:MAG: hypothetical protein ACRDN9_02875 [Streptosporangiaceae bacterium]